MSSVENKFLLTDVKECNGEYINFYIHLISKEHDISSVYMQNYFEGIYIEIGSQKYNLYAKKTDEIQGGATPYENTTDILIAEIRYETMAENALDVLKGNMRLLVKLRIGSTEIWQPVQICPNEICISFGHWSTFYFTPVDDHKFCFLKYSSHSKARIGAAKLNFVSYENDIIKFDITLPADLCNENIRLLRRNLSNNDLLYFSAQHSNNASLNYEISANELLNFDHIDQAENLFEIKLAYGAGNLCAIFADGFCGLESLRLPERNCYAVFIIKGGKLYLRVKEYLGFEFHNTDKDHITLKYNKRSYPIEFVEIIAHRVNTDIEYSLPIEISENASDITVVLHMAFDLNEEAFKSGVYQFWVVVRDGTMTKRTMLKILRREEMGTNIYFVQSHPYSIIGNHYYSCLFYCDSSNSLKCSISPKLMKTNIKCRLENNKLRLKVSVLKEPFFNEEISFSAITESGMELSAEKYDKIIDDNTNFAIDTLFDLGELFSTARNEIIAPMLTFGGEKEIRMAVQNNLVYVPSPKREIESFSEITTLNEKNARVWADFKGGAFVFGVSGDLRLCTFGNAECTDKKLIITAVFDPENAEFLMSGSITAELENVIDKKSLPCEISVVENTVEIHVEAALYEFGDYALWLTSCNGARTSIAFSGGTQVYKLNEADKKCEMCSSSNDALALSIRELLLFENSEKSERCRKIAEKSLENNCGKNSKVWLVGENYGLSARDNGLAFFEYCMQRNNPEADVYFVTKSENKDISALDKYKNNVVIYDSDKHLELNAIAEFYIVSHGIRDVMPSLYHNRIDKNRTPIIYLQHGITAMKKIGICNSTYGGGIRRFVTCSEFEKKLLIKNKQFWDDELAVTGFARYDKLSDDRSPDRKYIWIMPTWRDWLVSSRENFVNTLFFQSYKKLLTDDRILSSLRENGCKIVFSMHIEFEKYKPLFEDLTNDVIEITDMHSVDIGQRIRECRMIVTDYSSIIFDVVYLNKPALFFQFDKGLYDVYRGSYVDMETDLPGEVLNTADDLATALISMIEHNFEIPAEFVQRRKKFFDFEDQNNSSRIYNTILEVREEMSDEY